VECREASNVHLGCKACALAHARQRDRLAVIASLVLDAKWSDYDASNLVDCSPKILS